MRNRKLVIGAHIVTMVAAVGALIASVTNLQSQANENVKAIQSSVRHSCELDRDILLSFSTPRGKANAAFIFRLNPELRDCAVYARRFH